MAFKERLGAAIEPKPAEKIDVRLETSKGCHKVFDLAVRRGFAGFKVTLNAQSGEEGQHHLRNCGRSHPGFLGLDIHGEKTLQQRPILRHDSISLIRKDSELPHRIDGKTPLLFSLVKGTILEKSLDVFPAKRLLGEKTSLLLALKVVPQASYKEIFLVSELGVQPDLFTPVARSSS